MLARLFIVCGLLPLFQGQPAVAQTAFRDTLTVSGAATFSNSDFYAQTSSSHLFLLGLEYSHRLLVNEVFTLSYAPQILPFALFSQPRVSAAATLSPTPHPTSPSGPVYGAGASPIGLGFFFAPAHKIEPFVSTAAGFLYFTRNIPSPTAAQFNFTVEGRAGVRLRLHQGSALSFGYMFHHLSNAFEAVTNPGVDSQMLYFGYTFSLVRSH